MKSDKKAFTIRVYGLIINASQEVLIAEEMYKGRPMVKFPGGGLHWGESTIDCLKRECMEELGVAVEIGAHFYTTDFFIASAFDNQVQLVSIYYEVIAPANFQPESRALNRQAVEDEVFRFVPISDLQAGSFFTFPIDQKVGNMLEKRLRLTGT